MFALNRRSAIWCVNATCVLLFATLASAQAEIALPLPSSIEAGQCRPINLATSEMDKQWELHYRFAQRMRPSPQLVEAEKKSISAQAMIPERIECYAGQDIFAALCFTVSRTKSLHIRAVKLMHSLSGSDCLSLTTVSKK